MYLDIPYLMIFLQEIFRPDMDKWLMGKSLDNYTIMGPVIVDRTELPMPLELDIKSYVNGELRQNSNTKYLIKKVPGLIAELSQGITLESVTLLQPVHQQVLEWDLRHQGS